MLYTSRSEAVDAVESQARDVARSLGMELELAYAGRGLHVCAFELQTGIELTDLPRMKTPGYWESWEMTLAGLQELMEEFSGVSMHGGV